MRAVCSTLKGSRWYLIAVLAVFLFSVLPVRAQDAAAALLSQACGPLKQGLDVDTEKSNHTLAQPVAGKAIVYFTQDLGQDNPLLSAGVVGPYVTKVGIDGAWVGGEDRDSWFAVPVAPGEHHVCVNAQAHLFSKVFELAHFTAEADHVYYFRVRNFMWQSRRLEFGPVDSDEALYLIATSAHSTAQPKQ